MAVAFSFPQAQPTPLLGRTAELEEIVRRLTHEPVRLLSLTGPAGVGKTRLALAASVGLMDQFADGVTFVDLAPIRAPDLVLSTMARVLGLRDSGPQPLLERLREYLRDRDMLLILDNFEQVLPAAGHLADLLAAAPGLRMLVTSRVPLRLRSEQILRIYPLPVPEPDTVVPVDQLVQIPSVALFVERAQESLLSEREQEVLRLVAEGLTSKAIGQQIFLSPRTVDHHLTSIFNKLGVDTRAQAVAVAGQRGLL